MEQKDSAVDEFLGDLKNNEGDSVFEPSKENPFKDESVQTEEEEVKEEKIPFHKLKDDPKFQKFLNKEVEKAVKGMSPKEETQFRKEAEVDLVGALTQIIGNDTPEKVQVLKMFGDKFSELEKNANSYREEKEAQLRAEKQAEEELTNGLESVENQFNIDLSSNLKLKKEFLDFASRLSPKDRDGNIIAYPDFVETFKEFQEKKKAPSNNRARELAARSITRSGDASNPNQDRDYSWKGVEKALSRKN